MKILEIFGNLKIIISQPFAAKILTNSILNHFREGDPPKPLVLMLHGPTGVGKVRYFKGQLIFEFSTFLYSSFEKTLWLREFFSGVLDPIFSYSLRVV